MEAGDALRASLYLGGAVATAAGLHTAAAGALARAGAWIAAGRPHPAQRVLLAIELGAPVAVAALLQRPNRRAFDRVAGR